MGNGVAVKCQFTTEFPDEAYKNLDDKWNNAIILPRSIFTELETEPFTYIKAAPLEATPRSSEEVVLYAIPFDQEYTAELDAEKRNVAALRSNLMYKISPELKSGELIAIKRQEHVSSGLLQVKDSFADEITGDICYLHPSLLYRLVSDEGEFVEAYNPELGSRMLLSAWETRAEGEGEDVISIDGYSRTLLETELGGTLGVREVVNQVRPADSGRRIGEFTSRIKRGFLERFVDYRQISLRVESGLYRDEHRNIVRINDDMMESLGIDSGDQIIVEFKGRRITAQCLSPPEGENIGPLSVSIPSTSRDIIDVSIGDAVRVSRNMGYVFKKRATLSTLGVLAVIISTLSLVDIPLSNYPSFATNNPHHVIGFGSLLILYAAGVVWLLLYPERQRCTRYSEKEIEVRREGP